MKVKIRATAQKLVNLYRQAHVIIGGWSAINPIFIDEANDAVIQEIQELPTGKMLVQHINNLRSGKTPIDSIERELLPYGGMMAGDALATVSLTNEQWQELENGIKNFVPTQDGLNDFTELNVVRKFGEEWQAAISSLLQTKPNLRDGWATINQTYNAYRLWNTAHEVISNPLTERVRAQVQSDMLEFETYLPMFGNAGTELLTKLRTFISPVDSI